MATAHNPFKFFLGDTWLIEFTCLDEDGVALDITTADVLEWKLDDAANTINYFTYTLGSGVDIIDGPHGICMVTVQPAESAALNAAQYRDQFRLTLDGIVNVQCFGIINAIPALV